MFSPSASRCNEVKEHDVAADSILEIIALERPVLAASSAEESPWAVL